MRSIITTEEREPVNSKIYQYLLCLFVITHKDFNFISRDIEGSQTVAWKIWYSFAYSEEDNLFDCPNIDKNDRPTPAFPHHQSVLPSTTNLPNTPQVSPSLVMSDLGRIIFISLRTLTDHSLPEARSEGEGRWSRHILNLSNKYPLRLMSYWTHPQQNKDQQPQYFTLGLTSNFFF